MVLSRVIILLLITLWQVSSWVHAAECDPKIAEGAAAMALAEQKKKIELEWDSLTYELANYKVLGPEVVPIRLDQWVMTPDGTSGKVQRIENARNIAILDRQTSENRYVAVDLQKIHPVEHGAKPIRKGGMVWFKVDRKPKFGHVEDIIESQSSAVVIDNEGVRETIPLNLLAKDISGAKRIFYASYLPTLTGTNSILDMQNIHDFLNKDAFRTRKGIDQLKDGLALYGLVTNDTRDMNSLEYVLHLDLKASDPENSLVKFCVRANQHRALEGISPIEVYIAPTVETYEVSIVNKADNTFVETFSVKDLEDFVPPEYFDTKIHRIEHESFVTHAQYHPDQTAITLSHKNLMYILLEGHLGQSLHHEFGHANSFVFQDSFDRGRVDSLIPFLEGYPSMSFDENRQHLRNVRDRLNQSIKRKSITTYRLNQAKKVLNSIRRTAHLNSRLVDAVVDGGKDRFGILHKTIIYKIADEASAVFTLPGGTVAAFPNSKAKAFYSNKFLRLYRSLHAEAKLLLGDTHTRLVLTSDLQLSLYKTAKDALSRQAVRDYITEHVRISDLVRASLSSMLLEMNWVYQPMVGPASKAKEKIDYLLKNFGALRAQEKIAILQGEILPEVVSVWKIFVIHRNTQSKSIRAKRPVPQ